MEWDVCVHFRVISKIKASTLRFGGEETTIFLSKNNSPWTETLKGSM